MTDQDTERARIAEGRAHDEAMSEMRMPASADQSALAADVRGVYWMRSNLRPLLDGYEAALDFMQRWPCPEASPSQMSTELLESIANGKTQYTVDPEDAIRYAAELASEVLYQRKLRNAHQPGFCTCKAAAAAGAHGVYYLYDEVNPETVPVHVRDAVLKAWARQVIRCMWCDVVLDDEPAARAHVATCAKHPAVAELAKRSQLGAVIEPLVRAERRNGADSDVADTVAVWDEAARRVLAVDRTPAQPVRRNFSSTRTYALLEVSPAAYAEIRAKLEAAGYEHAFQTSAALSMSADHRHEDGRETLDLHGLALVADPSAKPAELPEDELALHRARFQALIELADQVRADAVPEEAAILAGLDAAITAKLGPDGVLEHGVPMPPIGTALERAAGARDRRLKEAADELAEVMGARPPYPPWSKLLTEVRTMVIRLGWYVPPAPTLSAEHEQAAEAIRLRDQQIGAIQRSCELQLLQALGYASSSPASWKEMLDKVRETIAQRNEARASEASSQPLLEDQLAEAVGVPRGTLPWPDLLTKVRDIRDVTTPVKEYLAQMGASRAVAGELSELRAEVIRQRETRTRTHRVPAGEWLDNFIGDALDALARRPTTTYLEYMRTRIERVPTDLDGIIGGERPKVFEHDGGVIVLSQVQSVTTYHSDELPSIPKCQVVMRGGDLIVIDAKDSAGLIKAVKAHHAAGAAPSKTAS